MRTFKALVLPLGFALVMAAAAGCGKAETEVVKTTYKDGEQAQKPAPEAPKAPPAPSMALSLDGSPSIGPAVAKVTMVESSDFQ